MLSKLAAKPHATRNGREGKSRVHGLPRSQLSIAESKGRSALAKEPHHTTPTATSPCNHSLLARSVTTSQPKRETTTFSAKRTDCNISGATGTGCSGMFRKGQGSYPVTTPANDTIDSNIIHGDLFLNSSYVSYHEIERQKREHNVRTLAEWARKKDDEERRKRFLQKLKEEERNEVNESKNSLETRLFKEWLETKNTKLKKTNTKENGKISFWEQKEGKSNERNKCSFKEWLRKKNEEFRLKRDKEKLWWKEHEDCIMQDIENHPMKKNYAKKLTQKINRQITAEMIAQERRRQHEERRRLEVEARRRLRAERPWAVWRNGARPALLVLTHDDAPAILPRQRNHPPTTPTASTQPTHEYNNAKKI